MISIIAFIFTLSLLISTVIYAKPIPPEAAFSGVLFTFLFAYWAGKENGRNE